MYILAIYTMAYHIVNWIPDYLERDSTTQALAYFELLVVHAVRSVQWTRLDTCQQLGEVPVQNDRDFD